jgi:hypothetical protein
MDSTHQLAEPVSIHCVHHNEGDRD